MKSCMKVMRGIAKGLRVLVVVGVGAALAVGAFAQQSPVPEDAQVEEVASGFEFTEGPYWHPDGYVLFSDIPANTIYQWTPGSSEAEVFLEPSGNSNGITADENGNLVIAQHGERRVARLDENKEETPVAEQYEGQRLNSPNDVAVASDGSVYFTDPPYGVDEDERELDFSGVFRVASDGEVELLTDEFSRPNGIILSPDETRLYVNDSEGGFIRVFDVAEDGTVSEGQDFAEMEDPDAEGNADGMTMDSEGNVYTTGPGGIWIFAPSGELLDRISVPQSATNVTFGGEDNQTLYITAQSSLYRVQVDATGAR